MREFNPFAFSIETYRGESLDGFGPMNGGKSRLGSVLVEQTTHFGEEESLIFQSKTNTRDVDTKGEFGPEGQPWLVVDRKYFVAPAVAVENMQEALEYLLNYTPQGKQNFRGKIHDVTPHLGLVHFEELPFILETMKDVEAARKVLKLGQEKGFFTSNSRLDMDFRRERLGLAYLLENDFTYRSHIKPMCMMAKGEKPCREEALFSLRAYSLSYAQGTGLQELLGEPFSFFSRKNGSLVKLDGFLPAPYFSPQILIEGSENVSYFPICGGCQGEADKYGELPLIPLKKLTQDAHEMVVHTLQKKGALSRDQLEGISGWQEFPLQVKGPLLDYLTTEGHLKQLEGGLYIPQVYVPDRMEGNRMKKI